MPPMIVELKKEYRFEAAHFLPRVPPGHKCARVHGHSYRIELALTGTVDPATGWLIDFGDIDDAWAELHARLDHRTLNDVPGLENSTSENLAAYLFAAMRAKVPQISGVTVWETADASCTYRGQG
jgi:6-pyruvoyltetrahydropterin/6-carboxytetrahydropterin synthase